MNILKIGLLVLFTINLKAQNIIDGFEPTANDWVRTMVQNSYDGDLFIGGRFTQLSHGTDRSYLAKLRISGSIDHDFDLNPNNEAVTLVESYPGEYLVGGLFTQINGEDHAYIAKFFDSGTLAPSFNAEVNGPVYAIAVQDDEKIIIGGSFTMVNGVARNRIARLDSDGNLDLSFDPGQGAEGAPVYSLLVQHDEKIVVGGGFFEFDGQPLARLVRLNQDGSLDPSLQAIPNAPVLTLAQQADHKLIIGGSFSFTSGLPQQFLARYHVNGQLDVGFNPNINDQVSVVKIAPNGLIYIGGLFTQVNGENFNRLAKIQDNGLLTFFRSTHQDFANDRIDTLLIQGDDKILVGGDFTESLGEQRIRLARFYASGELDHLFNATILGTSTTVNSTVQYQDIYVAGSFSAMNFEAHNNIAKLTMDGKNDDVFNAQSNGSILAMLALPNPNQNDSGKLLVGGEFTQINGLAANHIAKINAYDGNLDTSFNAFTNGNVHAFLHLEENDKYLIAGQFTQVNGSTRNNIALLNTDGSLDTDFDVSANNRVNSLALTPDGKVLMGGVFTEVNGFERQKLARFIFLNGNGYVDGFNPAPDGSVTSLLIQPNGLLWVGGFFDNIGGESRRGLAILSDEGNARLNMDLPLNSTGFVKSMALQANNALIIGGQISSIDGLPRAGVAKIIWDTATMQYSVDDWVVNTNATVNSIMLQKDGKVILGGNFDEVNGFSRHNLARLSQSTAALNTMEINENVVLLLQSGSAPIFSKAPIVRASGNNTLMFTQPMSGVGGWGYIHELEQNRRFIPTSNYDFQIRGHVASGSGSGSTGEVYFSKRAFFNDLIFKDGF